MTERQLRRLQQNRYVPRPADVFGSVQMAGWLSRVARQVQQLEDAAAAWARVAEPEWLADTKIRGLDEGVLVIAVASSATMYEVKRRASRLQRALAPYVRGLQRLRFVPATECLDDEESPGGGSAKA